MIFVRKLRQLRKGAPQQDLILRMFHKYHPEISMYGTFYGVKTGNRTGEKCEKFAPKKTASPIKLPKISKPGGICVLFLDKNALA